MSEPEQKKDKRKSHSRYINRKPEKLIKHLCVDCGKPTPDHRCPDCLVKWKMKHGVSLYDTRNDMEI